MASVFQNKFLDRKYIVHGGKRFYIVILKFAFAPKKFLEITRLYGSFVICILLPK